ncbi:hypothetical protein FB481_10463 [Pseudomonas sp. AG1028]|uniref:hypothetical protein n=1 Tax=Pseudomonas sp. AG1028 TaxID=2572911 RepID=UPI0011ACD607|nr:hypothetical protein [Pseudomonas sp. AG1028]TWE06982.1 hypothetical protein FB481_10463 [Pseudomonas sp. AG1028]
MKPSVLLSPLAFALAAVLATSAHATQPSSGASSNASGATAKISDTQLNFGNRVTNHETKNNASVDGSLRNASGNVGVNVAAGDNNQQANAAAIATADTAFVFGVAVAGSGANATTGVEQRAYSNNLTNYGNPNNASVNNSANGATGNLGVNVAAGNYNQQKNDTTIASSETAYVANASATVLQASNGNVTDNNQGTVFEDESALAMQTSSYGGSWWPQPQQEKTPSVNNASLSGSLAGVSGNVGVNIAAGGGNQQSNSLTIAAGCNACVAR